MHGACVYVNVSTISRQKPFNEGTGVCNWYRGVVGLCVVRGAS